MAAQRYTVLLTGGIASGKSTVSKLFEQHGIAVIDADLVSRELVAPGQPALAQITAHFGEQILDASGQLDRKQLREQVFANPGQRKILEGILHPAIHQRMQQLAEQAQSPYVLMVIPLLAESGQQYPGDRVLLVDVPSEQQLRRLQQRDDASEQLALQMLAAQASREQRLALADDVILNDGDIASLAAKVEKLHHRYLQLSQQ